MSKSIEQSKVLVSRGNLAFPAAGQVLWNCPTCDGVDLVFNGFPGQFVAYTLDEDTASPTYDLYITVDETTIATTDGEIFIGQFVDTQGKGYANDVRTIAGQSLGKCDLKGVKASGPSCPQPQILATYIDCIKCDETYTAMFTYSDNFTQSFGKHRADQDTLVCSITTECCSCDDCNPQANCDEIVGKLIDGFNKKVRGGRHKYPDRKIKDTGSFPKPYRFFKLHSNIFSYCLAPRKEECACDSCNTVDAITGITGGAAAGTEFNNNLNPAGDGTYLGQLDNIAKQIECALDDKIGPHAGTAFVTGGTDDCCPAQLWVITCDAGFALNIDPCDNGLDLFPEFTDKGKTTKRDCESGDCIEPEDKVSKFCCGIGVIIDQDRIECDCPCDIDVPPATLMRTGTFTFVKDAGSCTPTVRAKEILAPKPPTGSGGYVRWEEYNQSADGEHWRATSERQGYFGSLRGDRQGRMRNAAAFSDCRKQYCHYVWENKHDTEGRDGKTLIRCNYLTDFYIPTCDKVTIDSFTLFYQAFAAESSAKCNIVKAGTCIGQGDATLVEAEVCEEEG